jgi:hypothetical protein
LRSSSARGASTTWKRRARRASGRSRRVA